MDNITNMLKKCTVKCDINKFYEIDPIKKWIKIIPIDDCVLFEKYEQKHLFIKVADVILDEEIHKSDKNIKKRKTLIQFVPTILPTIFNNSDEWIYIFTVNARIVKIGGTRTGLKGRVSSYLCGHHITERGKSGDCSKTNAFIYNTFNFYLKNEYKIEMFGYKLPKLNVKVEILGEEHILTAQVYHKYESIFLEKFKKKYGEYPCLSDNSDPEYKE